MISEVTDLQYRRFGKKSITINVGTGVGYMERPIASW